jgi:hypothetical protein
MIALAYNDNSGGVHECDLRQANPVELQLGLAYVARIRGRYTAASILSAGAYSPDSWTLLYLDHMSVNRHIRYRSSFVTASHLKPWGGVSYDPQGTTAAFAGYGPKQKLLYAVYRPGRLVIGTSRTWYVRPTAHRWYLSLYPKRLTDTAGFSPVYAPSLRRIYFVEAGDNDTIRSTNEDGGAETVVKRFKDGWVRALAITQDRSNYKGERVALGDELIVSVYFPNEGQSSIFTGRSAGLGMSFTKRFTVPSDWAMVAGTGIFGGGTRIVFTAHDTLKVWDSRDRRVYDIRQWTTSDGIHHYHVPIPTFRHFVLGSGLALSPDNSRPKRVKRPTPRRTRAGKQPKTLPPRLPSPRGASGSSHG